jgi:hypothetical protein
LEVVAKYTRYTARQIAAASKSTPPFKKAKPGDVLEFQPPRFDARRPWGAPANDAERRSLTEVRAELGIA